MEKDIAPPGTPDMTEWEKIEFDHIVTRTISALGRNGLPHETNLAAAQDAAMKCIREYREMHHGN